MHPSKVLREGGPTSGRAGGRADGRSGERDERRAGRAAGLFTQSLDTNIHIRLIYTGHARAPLRRDDNTLSSQQSADLSPPTQRVGSGAKILLIRFYAKKNTQTL